MIHPKARAGRAWVVYGGPSAPRAARSLDSLVVDQPARLLQQPGDLAIAIAAYCRASAMVSAVSRSSSSRPRGTLRCVERCCPSAAQARRSETGMTAWICSIQARRRAGLRSFPGQPPADELWVVDIWHRKKPRHGAGLVCRIPRGCRPDTRTRSRGWGTRLGPGARIAAGTDRAGVVSSNCIAEITNGRDFSADESNRHEPPSNLPALCCEAQLRETKEGPSRSAPSA